MKGAFSYTSVAIAGLLLLLRIVLWASRPAAPTLYIPESVVNDFRDHAPAVVPSPPADSIRDFADLLIVALAQANFRHQLRWDAGSATILVDGQPDIGVADMYFAWRAADPEDRRKLLEEDVRGVMLNARGWWELDEVRGLLLPMVRTQERFAQVKAHGTPFGDGLKLGVVINFPDSMVYIGDPTLTRWKTDFATVSRIALGNLRQRSPRPFQEVLPGLWESRFHDHHDEARILLVEEIEGLKLKGGAVAMIPNRDTLLLAGRDDAQALLALAYTAENAVAGVPSPISMTPLCLERHEWKPCLPAASAEVRERFWAIRIVARAMAPM